MTSPEHGSPPQAASVAISLVCTLLPPPHVAEHVVHLHHPVHSQGSGGGVGPGTGGSHCSLLWKDIFKITWDLGCSSATTALYLSQLRKDE